MQPLRLQRVAGLEDRVNDVLYLPASSTSSTDSSNQQQTLVFFGGDVQDYPEIMSKHRDNVKYLQWNLERTTQMLAHDFPDHNIMVVRPARIEFQCLSCYDNFVPSNKAGVPDHVPQHGALLHMQRLLVSVSRRLHSISTADLKQTVSSTSHEHNDSEASTSKTEREPAPADLTRGALTVIGFSKGCVVLNQFVHEIHTELHHPTEEITRLIDQIKCMYWLDGGHSGGSHTWLTSRKLLQALVTTGVCIKVHVSGYQVCDESRPWIGREEKAFTNTLNKLGANLSRYFHDSQDSYSLFTHFSVLTNFKRMQDSTK